MAEDDKDMGLGELAGGAIAGTGAVAGTAALAGRMRFGEEGLKTLNNVATAAVGNTVQVAAGEGVTIGQKVTQGMIDHAKDVQKLVPEYEKAGHLGKVVTSLKGMSTGGRVGVAALAVGAAVGTAIVINKMRGKDETHVERLERERGQRGPREL